MEIFKNLFLLFINSYIIWKACDSFQSASLFLGRKMPAGARGATINAIGSSFPEFMTSFIAIFSYTENNGAIFGIANTTGSVMYNITMIPFFVILTCFVYKNIDKLHFNRNIIMREGVFLILIQLILMTILSSGEFNLLSASILIGIYCIYIYIIFFYPPHKKQQQISSLDKNNAPNENTIHHHRLPTKRPFFKALINIDLFSLFFPKSHVVTAFNATTVLSLSIVIFYFTCKVLVSSSYALGDVLGIPSYLVAITITAFATSVPDTILSMHDAKNGHFDDAITNAFGSNVFNISFCIAFPILIYILMNGGVALTFEKSSINSLNEFKTITNILVVFIIAVFLFSNKRWKFVSICLIFAYLSFVYSVCKEVTTQSQNLSIVKQTNDSL